MDEVVEKSTDAGDAGGGAAQALDFAQRLLTLETKLLLLEAKLSVLEKQSIDASQAVVAKQPEVTIYGSNRRIKRPDIK